MESQYRLLCWGLGSEAVGRFHPTDLYRCAWCGKKLRAKDTPLIFSGDRPSCPTCAITRHGRCPLHPTRAEVIKATLERDGIYTTVGGGGGGGKGLAT
jgi:DNA-directed RNA polymerase subunit RPC12/RpoP